MNWGLRNRLDRVLPGLPNGTGSVMFAIDHGYFMGPTSGLEDPRKTIVPLLPHADSLMLTRGILQNSIPKRTNIPIDPFYLTWKANEYGINTRFIELAGEINASMPEWVVGKASEALAKKGKDLPGAKVLILGVAYKKNVDDIRETPAFRIIELLREKKAKVDYHDPYVQQLHQTRKYNFQMLSVDLSEETLAEYDLVIIATDHDVFDYDLILQITKCIIDTGGCYNNGGNVVKA